MLEAVDNAGWYWLSFGMLLIAGEALGAAGFLLGAAVAALLLGAVVLLMPEMNWHEQVLSFAVLSIFFTVVYWKRFRRFNEKTDRPQLNQRLLQMVGTTHILETPVEDGVGRLQAGDTLWKVHCKQSSLPVGARVKVTGVKGTHLVVEVIS
jgi:membrane protein implicated in regulation of membrane protease activity